MSDEKPDNPFQAMEPIKEVKIAPAMGIAAMALNFALKYHDINTVQDGTLYQQYKLEGRNMQTLHLDHVFETAVRMEMHLLAGEKRIAEMIVDALTVIDADDEALTDAQPK